MNHASNNTVSMHFTKTHEELCKAGISGSFKNIYNTV